ncbi:UNVERIFIED_CONTAM: putative disease resistance RPP13-like protein 2 [Sesamum angustifolium]|uniref:Disease resistance RPP13-like protein 2 n=1 Tax=Sesamum angustifolium TaxID=2727405 RepID=A0AAW2QTZ7_9LAMI
MAVDAVASVILQKLRDLLLEESFTNNRVIGSQLKEMQEALESMRGYFIDAADKETDFGDIKKWTHDYLHHLYDVEDSIELFALRITRQRKRLGFLMNRALFLKKFTACKMLSRKLEKIQKRIEVLSHQTPAGLEDASLRSIRSQRSNFSLGWWADVNGAAEKYEEEYHKDEEEEDHKDEEEEENGLDLNPSVDVDDLRSKRRHSISSSIVTTTESPRSLLQSISFDLRSLVREASLIRERWEQSKLMYREASLIRERWEQSKLMYSYSYDEEKLSIVGYEREVPALLNRLTNEDECDDRIITVVGELGSGKTTLARAVYGNRIVKNWEKSKEQDGRKDEKFLKERLQLELTEQRYLIVLDGVQSLYQWESLKDVFPDEQNGSKIIITTCDEQLGRLADPERQSHSLKKLDFKESWDLFLRKVGLKEGPDNSTLKDRIIKVCRGLPLNIVLLGSLFSTKKDKGINEWPSILDNQENWSTSDILMFSYNDLDAHLKLCLLYMMLFPKELDIPVRRLQRLWLAEGFVKRPENNDIFQEDVVQGYFDDLVKRSLISVSKLRSDGSPRKCRLLGVLHDLLLTKARKKDTPAKDVAKLLNHMIGKGLGLLRVLDLEGVYKPSLPDNLGDLFHLRYLGLRWTFLDKLPKSVGELSYLETLDLKHTYINRIPPSIWKLKHLRHLSLNEIHLNKDMPLHSHTGSLPKLLTLWGLSVDQDSPIKNGLSKLTDLRELGITFRLSKCDDKDSNAFSPTPQFMQDLVEWISKLTNLQSLRLRSKNDAGRPADLSLNFGLEQTFSHEFAWEVTETS